MAIAVPLAAIVAAVGLNLQARSSRQPISAELNVVRPSVEVSAADQQARPARTGDSLTEGSVVRTGPSGLASLDYFDGSLTRLGPDTTFTVRTLNPRPAGREIVGGLDVGHSWQSVKSATGSGSRFEVHTSSAIGAVRGTRFGVSCFATCVFQVGEGVVEVSSNGRSLLVHAGEQVRVSRSGQLGDVEQLQRSDPWVILNMGLDRQSEADAAAEFAQADLAGLGTIAEAEADPADAAAPQPHPSTAPSRGGSPNEPAATPLGASPAGGGDQELSRPQTGADSTDVAGAPGGSAPAGTAPSVSPGSFSNAAPESPRAIDPANASPRAADEDTAKGEPIPRRLPDPLIERPNPAPESPPFGPPTPSPDESTSSPERAPVPDDHGTSPGSTPGNTGSAPGNTGSTPGNTGSTPGNTDTDTGGTDTDTDTGGADTDTDTDTGGADTDTGGTDTDTDTGGADTDTDTGGADTDTDTGGADTDTGGTDTDTDTGGTDTGGTDTDTDTGGTDTDTGGTDTDTGGTDTNPGGPATPANPDPGGPATPANPNPGGPANGGTANGGTTNGGAGGGGPGGSSK